MWQLIESLAPIVDVDETHLQSSTEDGAIGVISCQEEEDMEVVFDQQVNEKLKGKTLTQLKEAKASADFVSNNIEECIKELDKPNFEEPLNQQFKRIFGIEMPSSRMSIEQYYKVVIPVLKTMTRDNQTFFYEHYRCIVP